VQKIERRPSSLSNICPHIYDVKISGFTRSSIYIYIYIYEFSRLRVKGIVLMVLLVVGGMQAKPGPPA
jgi:hypothetical protein